MVSLNIGNVPTDLYNTLLELRGKQHCRTWVQLLQYLIQEPEGDIDFEFMSIDGKAIFANKIVFRTGKFVYEYDPARPIRPRDERFKQIHVLTEAKNHAKNH